MLVHLRHFHRKVKKFKHPLLDHVKPVTKEQAEELAANYFDYRCPETRDKLTLAMLSLLRNLVGRYLGNWPDTHRFKDEMIGEGLLSIVKTIGNLTPEVLNGRSVLQVVGQRAQKAIELMLYEQDNLAAPTKRTQENYSADGEEVGCLKVESDLTDVVAPDPASSDAIDLIDAEDALSVMAARLQLDADLLKPEYRNLTIEEVAARLGVHHSTVARRRAKLKKMYRVKFGG